MSRSVERYWVLGAGIISILLTLGIARFAYTPMLPIMQAQAGLGLSEGGWLAAINYMGYFCGAVIAANISDLSLKDRLYRAGLLVAVISTAGMGLTDNFWVWSAFRFAAGLSGAAGLLLGSGLILHWLLRHGHRSELGIHFSGIGLGVVLSALLVEWLNQHLSWDMQWWGLTAVAALLMIPAWRWLPRPEKVTAEGAHAHMQDVPPSKAFMRVFLVAYFCAGVGFVVSVTFIVAIVEGLPGLAGKGGWVFMVLGLAAAPACMAWDLVARRIGYLNSLLAAALLQIVGILLPVIWPDLLGAMLGSALFGATFVAIVSLVLTMAGKYYPTRPAKMMGKMTVAYGVAQIVAPAMTGMLAEQSGSYSTGLYIAAAIMGVGTLLLFTLKQIEKNEKSAASLSKAASANH